MATAYSLGDHRSKNVIFAHFHYNPARFGELQENNLRDSHLPLPPRSEPRLGKSCGQIFFINFPADPVCILPFRPAIILFACGDDGKLTAAGSDDRLLTVLCRDHEYLGRN